LVTTAAYAKGPFRRDSVSEECEGACSLKKHYNPNLKIIRNGAAGKICNCLKLSIKEGRKDKDTPITTPIFNSSPAYAP